MVPPHLGLGSRSNKIEMVLELPNLLKCGLDSFVQVGLALCDIVNSERQSVLHLALCLLELAIREWRVTSGASLVRSVTSCAL